MLTPFIFSAYSTASPQSELTVDHIISKLEQQLHGKVISVSDSKADDFYRVRFIKTSAEIVILTVDPETAKIIKQEKARPTN